MSTAPLNVASLLAKREVVRFLRQRARVVAAIATPLMLWAVAGMGLGTSFQAPGVEGDYLAYLFPGMLVLTVVFAAIFGAFSSIEDRKEGFMQGVLVAPVPRWAIAFGKVLGSAFIAWLQGIVLLPLAYTIGLNLSAIQIIEAAGWLALIALGQAGLGFSSAWACSSTQSFHGVMNLVLMPMWILSGAAFPLDGAYDLLGWLMQLNPLTYGLDGMRGAMGIDGTWQGAPSSLVSLIVTIGFGLLMLGWATRSVKRNAMLRDSGKGPSESVQTISRDQKNEERAD